MTPLFTEKEFWQLVNALIKKQKLTQKSLASICELPERRIESLSSYNRLPNLFEAYKIAQALGVSMEYLVTGFESDTAKQELEELKRKLAELAQ